MMEATSKFVKVKKLHAFRDILDKKCQIVGTLPSVENGVLVQIVGRQGTYRFMRDELEPWVDPDASQEDQTTKGLNEMELEFFIAVAESRSTFEFAGMTYNVAEFAKDRLKIYGMFGE